MAGGTTPAEWIGRHVVLALPEHLKGARAARVGDELVNAIADGATVVVADMSATQSCDHAGIDGLSRAYLRAAIAQAEFRLVVDTPAARELVTAAGLDRLVAVFPSVTAALAAHEHDGPGWPSAAVPVRPARQEPGHASGPGPGRLTAPVLRALVDALDDGIALTDDDGTIVLASRKLASMFGYEQDELAGRPVGCLVRGDLRGARRDLRIAHGLEPVQRPLGERPRLAGQRKDGSSLPVTITMSPAPAAGDRFVLVVVKDATRSPRTEDLAAMARAAAEQEERSEELLGHVVTSLFHVGMSLQAAERLPAEQARERLTDVLGCLDEVIRDIRSHVFRSPGSGGLLSAFCVAPAVGDVRPASRERARVRLRADGTRARERACGGQRPAPVLDWHARCPVAGPSPRPWRSSDVPRFRRSGLGDFRRMTVEG